jgi:hypothetical protein
MKKLFTIYSIQDKENNSIYGIYDNFTEAEEYIDELQLETDNEFIIYEHMVDLGEGKIAINE